MELITALGLTLSLLSTSQAHLTESNLWEKVYLKNKSEDACRALKNDKDDFKLIRLNRIKVGMSECAMQLAAKVSGGMVESSFEDKRGAVRVWRFPACAFGRMDGHIGVDCYNETIVNTRNGIITSIFHED